MHIKINNKFLSIGNYKVKCSIGKRGIAIKKREGDFITPRGKFRIMYALYRKDRIPALETIIKKTVIKKDMGWCDDPASVKYNKLIRFPFINSAEKLHKRDNTYDIILVLNYNAKPIKRNKGSAIFIHISKKIIKRLLDVLQLKKVI